jgi:xanthine/uracil permease
VALAKTEMSEKASKFSRNAVYLAIGGLVAYAGFMFILLMLMRLLSLGLIRMGLSEGLVSWLAPAIIGLIVAAVGYALVQKAINTFSRESLAPEKTIQSLKEDKQWTQEKFSRAA